MLLENEILILRKVKNRNIVKLYEVYEDSSYIYLVQEYLEGGDLSFLLRQKKKLHEEEAKMIMTDLVNGLEYLHRKLIIHRDIKPQNLILK